MADLVPLSQSELKACQSNYEWISAKSVSESQRLHPLAGCPPRGFAAHKMEGVVWNMREAHVPHHTLHALRAPQALASGPDGNQTHPKKDCEKHY